MRFNVVFHEITKVDVAFNQITRVRVTFNQIAQQIPVKFSSVHVVTDVQDVEHYEGDYAITPHVNAQVVPTANKMMYEDLNVKAIPYYDTSNNAGGSTVYIGKMDE